MNWKIGTDIYILLILCCYYVVVIMLLLLCCYYSIPNSRLTFCDPHGLQHASLLCSPISARVCSIQVH